MKKRTTLQESLQSISNGGFNGLITPTTDNTPKQKKGRKAHPDRELYGRMCAVVRKDLQLKLQIIASRHGLQIKEVLEEAMSSAVASYEKKHGVIEIPEGNKKLF